MTSSHSTIRSSDSEAFWGAGALLMGFLVAVLGFTSVMMWIDAHNARDDVNRGAVVANAGGMAGMPGVTGSSATAAGGLTSYSGAAPANADELAAGHAPYPATLPPAQAGPVADVNLVLSDITTQIAPGVKYAAWAWSDGAPGPVIHVRQGQ